MFTRLGTSTFGPFHARSATPALGLAYRTSADINGGLLGQHPARQLHRGGNPGENLKSISHLREVEFVWELTKETIYLPMGCLQGGYQVGHLDFRAVPRLQGKGLFINRKQACLLIANTKTSRQRGKSHDT